MMDARLVRYALTLAAALAAARAEALEVVSTSCEHLATPYGLEATHPRLSWKLRSDQRGDHQTAYQVLVATSPERLARDEGDAWDSGRVESGGSQLVPYAGRELASQEHLYWKVRAWDAEGGPSDWSEPAEWLTGLMGDAEWGAEWIGLPVPDRTSHLGDAQWVWFPEGEPTASAPVGVRYFRRQITIRDQPITHAVWRITGDDKVNIHLNGRLLGGRSGPNSTKELDLGELLVPGVNQLAVSGENRGREPNPAGMISWLEVVYADGERQLVFSDADWVTSDSEQEGWLTADFDDSGWRGVKVLGEVGCEPWGEVRFAEDRRLPARYLRRGFELDKPIERAVVSWCGLGCSELFVNGERVGDQVMSPAMSHYPERAYYLTRDVTESLRRGENVVAACVGNGRFYSPRSNVYAGMPSYGSPMLRLRLRVSHPDGTTTELVSDASWRLTDRGPIVANNEYDGEEHDARLGLGDWRLASYDDSDWRPAEVLNSPTKRLDAEPIAPMRVVETIRPVAITEPKAGVYVVDLGQNIAGWCRLKVEGPAGTTVHLRHAERLTDEGLLYRANLRGAKATDRYTLRGGGPEVWEPSFTLHGFRFVEVTGYPGELTADAIAGRVVHDDLRSVGEFECGNETVNRVYQNVRWGFRGNYRTVPLDCPQRDERQGWLGDRLETARSESYVFDVAAFYRKWLGDIRDSQRDDGALPDIAPVHWPRYSDNVVWPSTSVLLPGILRDQYGDDRPTAEQYECNVRWVDHMLGYLRDDGLIDRDAYGDWCVPPEEPELIHSRDPARITDTTFLASVFFYYDLKLMAQDAGELGHSADAVRFNQAADKLKQAINRAYYDRDAHQYSNGTQTSSVLPLAFGLAPRGEASRLADTLVRHVSQRDGGAIATGLVGGQFLCRTLNDHGRPDLAFAIAARREYPSWGYMASQGATTVWELWNGDTADPAMNSGNHVMLVGDLVTWLYEDLAGIAPDPREPGFRRIVMRPQFVEGLPSAWASFDSPQGLIESDWRRDGDRLEWNVLVPPGATAEVHLPTDDADATQINGGALGDLATLIGARDGRFVIELPSGRYRLTSATP